MPENENPMIHEPLEAWAVKLIDAALLKHSAQCPMPERIAKLEINFARLIGFMIGSGVIGGAVSAIIQKTFS